MDREKEIEAEYLDDMRQGILRRHELMCIQIITDGEVLMKHFSTAQDAANGVNYKELALRYYDNGAGFKNKYKFKKDFKTMTAQEKITVLYEMALELKERGVSYNDILALDYEDMDITNKEQVDNIILTY